MSVRDQDLTVPVLAAEAIVAADIGKLCYDNSGIAIADDGATQGAAQALQVLGVITHTAASGERNTPRRFGVYNSALAGAGGVSRGDLIVAEASTGKCIAFDPQAADAGIVYIAGQALTDASADEPFSLDLDARCALYYDDTRGTSASIAMGDAAATFTDAQHLVEFLDVDPESGGASETLTTRTAAQLITAGVVSATRRQRTQLIYNSGDEHVTLAEGSGVTITSSGADLVIEDGELARVTYVYIGAGDVRILLDNDGA